MRIVRLRHVLLSVLLLLVNVPQATAQSASIDLASQLTAGRNVAILRERRLADEAQLEVISRYEIRLARANERISLLEQSHAASMREREQLARERDDARRDFTSFVMRLSDSSGLEPDVTAGFLSLIRQSLASASPEMRTAMQRFADGDRKGAQPVLEEILRAEDAAQLKANDVRRAVNFRVHAIRYDEMVERGEATVAKAAAAWDAVVKLDPSKPYDWRRLAQLRLRLGDHRAAEADFERALSVATAVPEKVVLIYDLLGLEQTRRDAGLPTGREQVLNRRLAAVLGVDIPPPEPERRDQLARIKDDLDFLQRLRRRMPSEPPLSDQAWVVSLQICTWEADVARRERHFDHAERRLRECRSLLQNVVMPNQPRPKYLELSWDLEETAADLFEDREQYRLELAARRNAARLGAERAQVDQTDLSWLHRRGWTQMGLARALVVNKRRGEALTAYEEGLAYFCQDLASDPHSVFKHGSLRDGQIAQQALLITDRAFDRASAALNTTESCLTGLADRLAGEERAAVLYGLGHVRMRRVELATAREDYSSALQLMAEVERRLTLAAPGAPKSRDDVVLAALETLRGQIARSQGNKPTAIHHYLRAFDICATYVEQPLRDEAAFVRGPDEEVIILVSTLAIGEMEDTPGTWAWALGWIDRAEKIGVAKPKKYAPELRRTLARARKLAAQAPSR